MASLVPLRGTSLRPMPLDVYPMSNPVERLGWSRAFGLLWRRPGSGRPTGASIEIFRLPNPLGHFGRYRFEVVPLNLLDLPARFIRDNQAVEVPSRWMILSTNAMHQRVFVSDPLCLVG